MMTDRSITSAIPGCSLARGRSEASRGFFGYPLYVLSHFPRAMIDKVFDQHRNIFPSFSQRGNLDWKNIEPIKQVTTKGSRSDGRLQITVGSSYHAVIRLDGPSSADNLKFVFQQNTQQSNLGFERKLSHFIEEDRASLCQFETAEAPLQRSGKRALLIPSVSSRRDSAQLGHSCDGGRYGPSSGSSRRLHKEKSPSECA
jgi:hypothetical protein